MRVRQGVRLQQLAKEGHSESCSECSTSLLSCCLVATNMSRKKVGSASDVIQVSPSVCDANKGTVTTTVVIASRDITRALPAAGFVPLRFANSICLLWVVCRAVQRSE